MNKILQMTPELVDQTNYYYFEQIFNIWQMYNFFFD